VQIGEQKGTAKNQDSTVNNWELLARWAKIQIRPEVSYIMAKGAAAPSTRSKWFYIIGDQLQGASDVTEMYM
jgi:hypothetical protein